MLNMRLVQRRYERSGHLITGSRRVTVKSGLSTGRQSGNTMVRQSSGGSPRGEGGRSVCGESASETDPEPAAGSPGRISRDDSQAAVCGVLQFPVKPRASHVRSSFQKRVDVTGFHDTSPVRRPRSNSRGFQGQILTQAGY